MNTIKIILILEIILLDVFAIDEVQLEVTTEDIGARIQMQLFNDFKDTYHKQYATTEIELKAKKSFLDNVALVNAHNVKFDHGETSFRLGISELSDSSPEELNFQLSEFKPIKFSRKATTTEATPDTTVELLTCEQTNQVVNDELSVNERIMKESLNDIQEQTLELNPDSKDWRFAFQSIRSHGELMKLNIVFQLTFSICYRLLV